MGDPLVPCSVVAKGGTLDGLIADTQSSQTTMELKGETSLRLLSVDEGKVVDFEGSPSCFVSYRRHAGV